MASRPARAVEEGAHATTMAGEAGLRECDAFFDLRVTACRAGRRVSTTSAAARLRDADRVDVQALRGRTAVASPHKPAVRSGPAAAAGRALPGFTIDVRGRTLTRCDGDRPRLPSDDFGNGASARVSLVPLRACRPPVLGARSPSPSSRSPELLRPDASSWERNRGVARAAERDRESDARDREPWRGKPLRRCLYERFSFCIRACSLQ
jgi:hypothetical protein